MGFGDRFDARESTPGNGAMSGVAGGGPAVGVFVSAGQGGPLETSADAAPRLMTVLHAVTPAEAIAAESFAGLAAAVVEVCSAERKSIDRLTAIVRQFPGMPVIAAIAGSDVGLVRTLVRAGISDVISLPIDAEELTNAALDAQARKATPAVNAPLAPMVCVVRSSGGCGATTVATHLASELARREWGGRGVLLGDLDLQFGSVGAYLDISRSGSIPDLVAARDRVDPYLLQSLAPETTTGLAVLSAPEQIVPVDTVEVDALLGVIEDLRRHYGLVVLDFPADWSNWSASLAYAADLILVVTELTLPSMRQTRRCLDLFATLGIPPEKAQLVANKVENRMFRPINLGDVSQTLGKDALGALPAEAEALHRAQDQGLLVDAIVRRSAFAAAVRKLADTVEARVRGGGPA